MPFRRTVQPEGELDGDAASIPALLKRLGRETTDLLRAEIALAKLEVRDVARQAALDGFKLGAALALAFVGALTLTAWAVLALGDLLGGRHATAALILGFVFLVVGGLLARSARKSMSSGALRPDKTLGALERDRQLAAEQLRHFKQELQRSGDADTLPTPRA